MGTALFLCKLAEQCSSMSTATRSIRRLRPALRPCRCTGSLQGLHAAASSSRIPPAPCKAYMPTLGGYYISQCSVDNECPWIPSHHNLAWAPHWRHLMLRARLARRQASTCSLPPVMHRTSSLASRTLPHQVNLPILDGQHRRLLDAKACMPASTMVASLNQATVGFRPHADLLHGMLVARRPHSQGSTSWNRPQASVPSR